ncbi:MAG TPA: hypothetical protein VHD76_17100 [Bryobacteraceae bacterium]|jgi:hypothetical protein|nr:hypothetical protein [Bryobacteraceae bacterium]
MDEMCPACRCLVEDYRRQVVEYAEAIKLLESAADFGGAYERVQEIRLKCRETELALRECTHHQNAARIPAVLLDGRA